jgi:hypothetical protein
MTAAAVTRARLHVAAVAPDKVQMAPDCCCGGLCRAAVIATRYHYTSLALRDTRTIAALITLQLPKAFTSVLPAVRAAALALVVVVTVCVWALYAWRSKQQLQAATEGRGAATRGRFVAVAAFVSSLLYGLAVLLMVIFALSLLWMGGGMVASKATMDAASTMSVVDEQIPSLIRTAMNIDPAKVRRAADMPLLL